jgi:membrane-associated protein
LFTVLGFAFGGVTFIKNNIELIVVLLVALSVLPMVLELRRNRRKSTPASDQAATD